MIAKYGHTAYKLDLPIGLKIHPVFHVSLLKKYTGLNMEADAVEVDEEQEFEIDSIVGHAAKRGRMHFLVKWVGYDHSHNQYLPEEELINAPKILRNYKRRHKLL